MISEVPTSALPKASFESAAPSVAEVSIMKYTASLRTIRSVIFSDPEADASFLFAAKLPAESIDAINASWGLEELVLV